MVGRADSVVGAKPSVREIGIDPGVIVVGSGPVTYIGEVGKIVTAAVGVAVTVAITKLTSITIQYGPDQLQLLSAVICVAGGMGVLVTVIAGPDRSDWYA